MGNQWELTREEINELIELELKKKNEEYKRRGWRETSWLGDIDEGVVAKAAQKKLVEWLEGILFKDRYYWHPAQRFLLSDDWYNLLESLGIKE